jgi:hypothetical protein
MEAVQYLLDVLLSYLLWTLPQNGTNTSNVDLPSWVPDWSVRHTVPVLLLSVFQAGGRGNPTYRDKDKTNGKYAEFENTGDDRDPKFKMIL